MFCVQYFFETNHYEFFWFIPNFPLKNHSKILRNETIDADDGIFPTFFWGFMGADVERSCAAADAAFSLAVVVVSLWKMLDGGWYRNHTKIKIIKT